ncbi:hypothetical protein HYU20_01180 [Candidatus Woesearchaeota archaeon]|nr:hypothetical protein [Candidatus Woesearchaeota archaeon]
MALDSVVSGWSLKHEDRVLDFLLDVVERHVSFYGEALPPAAMALGDNWAYTAFLAPAGQFSTPLYQREGSSFCVYGDHVAKVRSIGKGYASVAELLEQIVAPPATTIRIGFGNAVAASPMIGLVPDGLVLIPLSESRKAEAKGLGPVVSAPDDWYTVAWNNRQITVLTFGHSEV